MSARARPRGVVFISGGVQLVVFAELAFLSLSFRSFSIAIPANLGPRCCPFRFRADPVRKVAEADA